MLRLEEATKFVLEMLPGGKIQAQVDYKNLYLFQVFTDDDLEGQWDPFYSVNKETGEFRDFSVITDGDTAEILSLFEQVKGR